MNLLISPAQVSGLRPRDAATLQQLCDVYHYHFSKNATKLKYYEGHVTLEDVNLGIAIPDGIKKLQIGCEWGAKTVDVLASRSMFDGFVGANGEDTAALTEIMDSNNFLVEYQKACRDELKYACSFITLAADDALKCKIRIHSPRTGAGLWNGEKGRMDAGLFVIDTVKDEQQEGAWIPSLLRMDTDTDVIILRRDGFRWSAEYRPHRMGRPLVVPLIWNATSDKPFGRSRIKAPIRNLIDGYIRTVANMSIALEFDTTPQKYILGVTDEQYDEIVSSKFKAYVGSILAATQNPETGENPQFGQLAQGNIAPHVEMLRALATQFSAATGLTVTDTGVVNDANPTSSEAILAQSQTLVLLAEQLNASNGNALRLVAQMAQAIARSVTLDELTDDERDIVPHFKNPALPSISVTADAALKIASTRENFGQTDVFLEMLGFDQAEIRRIKAQEVRARGLNVLSDVIRDTEET